MIDQLSQESIIDKTSKFLLELFKDQFKVIPQNGQQKGGLYSDVKNLAHLSTKILQQNFDYANDEIFLRGVSFYLFGKISQVYSQNVGHYYVMERIMGQLFEKCKMLHLDFVLILTLINWSRNTTSAVG